MTGEAGLRECRQGPGARVATVHACLRQGIQVAATHTGASVQPTYLAKRMWL